MHKAACWSYVCRACQICEQERNMDALYSVMQGLESRLGGGEGVEGIYGSITATGMHKVLECLRINCNLTNSSVLVDIGAGLGRPLLHALLLHNIAHGYGVELDKVKVAKADAFCKGVLEELTHRGVITDCPIDHSQQQQQQVTAVAGDGCIPLDQQEQGQVEDSSCSKDSVSTAAPQHLSPSQTVGASSSDVGNTQDDIIAATQGSCNSDSSAVTTAAAGRGAAVKGVRGRRASSSSKAKGTLRPPNSVPIITCASIEQISSLEPATHAYSFWEGVPLSGKKAFGRLFRQAKSLKAVAVVQRAIRGEKPEVYMRGLGFGPLQLITAFAVNMSGSGRSFQAYIFTKTQSPLDLLRRHGGSSKTPSAAAKVAAKRQTAAAAADDAGDSDGEVHLEAGLASCTKPPRSGAAAAAAPPVTDEEDELDRVDDATDSGEDDEDLGSPAAAGVSGAAATKKQQQLLPLLTEELLRQRQQQQQSPQKRASDIATATAALAREGSAESPSKKQRGVATQQQQPDYLAAAPSAASGSTYSLRRRLNLGNSSSGPAGSSMAVSGSSSGSSKAQRAGSTAAKQRQQQRSASGGKANLSVAEGCTAASGSLRSTAAGSSRGSRSTAVSGGRKKTAQAAK